MMVNYYAKSTYCDNMVEFEAFPQYYNLRGK